MNEESGGSSPLMSGVRAADALDHLRASVQGGCRAAMRATPARSAFAGPNSQGFGKRFGRDDPGRQLLRGAACESHPNTVARMERSKDEREARRFLESRRREILGGQLTGLIRSRE